MSGIATCYSRSWEFGEPIAPRLKWSLTSPPKELWHHYLHVMIVIVFAPVVVVVRIPWIALRDILKFFWQLALTYMSGIITGYSRSWEFGEPIAPRLKWSLTSPPKELWHHYLHVMIVIVFAPAVVVVRIPRIVKDVCAFNPGPKSLNTKSW